MMKRHLHLMAGLGLALLASATRAELPKLDYPIHPNHIFLLNIADSGERLAAVGERGVVMLGDAKGEQWSAVRTDSNRTLAGIAFVDPRVAVAVGHGGTLLRSEDGGQNWKAVDADTNGDALLGVAALGEGRLAAWGAFGLYLLSTDNGASWERRTVIDEDFDRHISQVLRLANGDWLMVGESGTLNRSADAGETWTALESPYEGSFFGALQTRSGDLLAYGMRGNLWSSNDGGLTWSKRETGTTIAFNGGVQLESGRILVFGNSGLMLASDDQGASFKPMQGGRASLAKALQLADGRLIAVGDRGVTTLDVGAGKGQE